VNFRSDVVWEKLRSKRWMFNIQPMYLSSAVRDAAAFAANMPPSANYAACANERCLLEALHENRHVLAFLSPVQRRDMHLLLKVSKVIRDKQPCLDVGSPLTRTVPLWAFDLPVCKSKSVDCNCEMCLLLIALVDENLTRYADCQLLLRYINTSSTRIHTNALKKFLASRPNNMVYLPVFDLWGLSDLVEEVLATSDADATTTLVEHLCASAHARNYPRIVALAIRLHPSQGKHFRLNLLSDPAFLREYGLQHNEHVPLHVRNSLIMVKSAANHTYSTSG
jgi:hypothetical protein